MNMSDFKIGKDQIPVDLSLKFGAWAPTVAQPRP